MSRFWIFGIYVLVDFLIVAGVLWAAFYARWPVRQFLLPAAVLFVLNGVWLVVMTIRNTPPGGSN
ncbi:MAG TPA: hypothetical protein VFL42_07880 [Terriglobales bacterium]|nr:hypothetical protein [Terriglobales bacterium]